MMYPFERRVAQLLLGLLVCVSMVLSGDLAYAEAECRSCEGLDDAGGGLKFRLEVPAAKTYAPGKLNVFRQKDALCCPTSSIVTYPSSRILKTDKNTHAVYLEGLDGLRKGGFSKGILRYDLAAGTMEPVISRVIDEKRCKNTHIYAFVHTVTVADKATKQPKKERTLSVLNLDAGYPTVLSTVKTGSQFHRKKGAFDALVSFTKNCKSLNHPGSKTGEKLTFQVPEQAPLQRVKGAQEVQFAVLGNIVKPVAVKEGKAFPYPLPISFSIEEIVPMLEVGTEGMKTMSYRASKKALERFNLIYLTEGTPIQVVLKGNDQIPLEEYEVVSVEHR
jgi:hypothetical protein